MVDWQFRVSGFELVESTNTANSKLGTRNSKLETDASLHLASSTSSPRRRGHQRPAAAGSFVFLKSWLAALRSARSHYLSSSRLAAVYSYGFSNNAIWPQALRDEPGWRFQFHLDSRRSGAALTQGSANGLSAASTQKLQRNVQLPAGTEISPPLMALQVDAEQRGSLLNVEWSYQLDALSSIFMLIVTGVGFASLFSPPATCMAIRASIASSPTWACSCFRCSCW